MTVESSYQLQARSVWLAKNLIRERLLSLNSEEFSLRNINIHKSIGRYKKKTWTTGIKIGLFINTMKYNQTFFVLILLFRH